ncbi:MAG: MBL fold metallo-hydrolase [Methanomicrobiaceae archaeon]|uniref:Metal-dependent hydrolase of the beta-lactamase superfamily i n=1 Tax=hydrocarbon metagenome TaxID=938273 RepID=A0A0W8FKD2_9ZZZZ|nr:MBL fold metallo-hydrolase [Methanomicrobiaceae archaeon]MDD5419233.1 MBL fold metallo-hydrolase [Methanomicrobiaceae archaeon]
MEITVLGTGDAIGTPKVGCSCETCTAARAAGRSRLRTSLLVEAKGKRILIDSSPDLRQQLLRSGSPHIDAVFWTHGHYDHFIGYGEFYRVQKMPPVYAAPPVLAYSAKFFHFLPFKRCQAEVYTPFDLFGVRFTFFEVHHPPGYACGIRMEHDGAAVAYTSDTTNRLPGRTRRLLEGVDLLFVDAIAPAGYEIEKHMNYPEACALAAEVGARDFRCVHMSHLVPWDLPHAGTDMERLLLE